MFAKVRSLLRSPALQRPAPGASHVRPTLETLEERAAPSGIGAAALGGTGNVSRLDAAYLTFSAQGNQQEIMLGNLAEHNSSNPTVQAFGQTLVTDHTNAMDKEVPILQQAGLSVPGLNQNQLRQVQTLQGLSGLRFDLRFTTMMIVDHVNDIAAGMVEQGFGTDSAAKTYAAEQAPVLQDHLATAISIELQLLNSLIPGLGHNSGASNLGQSGSGQSGMNS